MAVEPLVPPNSPPVKGPYAPVVRAGDWYVFAGQIGTDWETNTLVDGGTVGEAKKVFANIAGILDDLGLGIENIARMTVFLTDLADYQLVNEVYAEFVGDHRPARTSVQVAALPAGAHIEIEAWAYTG